MAVTMEVRGTGEWLEVYRAGMEPVRFERMEMVLRRDGVITKRWNLVESRLGLMVTKLDDENYGLVRDEVQFCQHTIQNYARVGRMGQMGRSLG